MTMADSSAHGHPPAGLRTVDILAITAALMIGPLAAALLGTQPPAGGGLQATAAGTTPVSLAAATDNSVPDAGIVFAAAKLSADDAYPTF